MPVTRYRSIADMPPPWRDADDPGNLRMVALMLSLHRRLGGAIARPECRVQRFRSIQDSNAALRDADVGPSPRRD